MLNEILRLNFILTHNTNRKMRPAQTTSKLSNKIPQEVKRRQIMKICRQFPYQINSSMSITYVGTTTYTKMFKLCGGQKFMNQLKGADFNKLNDEIFVFAGQIQPEDVKWDIWHHRDQIQQFYKRMQGQIQMMNKYTSRICKTGRKITQIYEKLKDIREFNQPEAKIFMEFLNLVVNHDYLKKSVISLTFVEHCLPMNLWNLKSFQQIQVYKSKNFISKMFSKQNIVDYYLTVTTDGILLSTKNLLQTKIDKMIPFTNQFTFDTKFDGDKNLIFQLSSCINEVMNVNLQQNYMGGINFFLGLKQALGQSDLYDPHRFNSFSQPRQNCGVKLYNDGQWYFSDLCDQLRKARHQVCITDWWMTPYFLLKRPDNIQNTANRLDGVLKQLSDEGVKIFIILFRQPLNMLCNDSEDAQFYLESLGRNIRVRRHPIVPQLWSHHEKCVIIDQQVGFMGGLDICYGRWDNPQHSLTNKNDNWNGADYTNQRLRGFTPGTTKNIQMSPADRQYQPRMPWHDIGIQLRGDAVIDLARHFIQYWYFVDSQKAKDPYSHLSSLKKRYDRSANYQQPDWDDKGIDAQRKRSVSQNISLCGKRTQLFVVGAQRRLPQLLIQVRKGQKQGNKKLQLCRSASAWSIGAKQTEHSIHNAYQQLIMQSQNFVYIQNQFFMGKQNKIVQCLASRIRKAHNKGENFKVVVVMPLLPGFDGQITSKTSGPLRIQVHNQYYAINRGPNSLYDRLKDLQNFDMNRYIYFFGLRGHAFLNKRPVTEIVYVHSKLMIVDDKRAIIGSANINDRSLLGSRDSQLAIVIQQDNGLNLSDNRPRRDQIFEFRCRIFNQHFGLSSEETSKINSPQIWGKIIANSKNNTLIYRKIFGCYPDNTITVADQVQQRKFEASPSLYHQLAPKIVAHAVQLPLQFMKDQDLEFQFGDKQGLAGEEAFL